MALSNVKFYNIGTTALPTYATKYDGFFVVSNGKLYFGNGTKFVLLSNEFTYTHPTYEEATPAAVKIGRDATGHVVIGDALTPSDIGAAPAGSYEVTTNKSTNVTTDATSDEKYPSVKAVKTYVDGAIGALDVTTAIQPVSASVNSSTKVGTLTFAGVKETDGKIVAGGGTGTQTFATPEYVDGKIGDLAGALIYKGTVGSGGTVTSLPTTNVATGTVYVVKTNGTYAEKLCEVGDYCIYNGSTWDIVNGENQVADNNPTLEWSTKSKVATVDGEDIHVTMPENPVLALDVTTAIQAVSASVNSSTKVGTLTFGGIKETDGIIVAGGGTGTQTFATPDYVTNAIGALDVTTAIQAVSSSVDASTKVGTLTFAGVKETDGKIVAGGGTGTQTFATPEYVDNKFASVDQSTTTITNDDEVKENTGIEVLINAGEVQSGNDYAYTISASAEMKWLTTLP